MSSAHRCALQTGRASAVGQTAGSLVFHLSTGPRFGASGWQQGIPKAAQGQGAYVGGPGAFIGRNLNRFQRFSGLCVMAPPPRPSWHSAWWARWAPHTTPRRRPPTASDFQSRMKHESPQCAHIPTDGPTEKQHGRTTPQPRQTPARAAHAKNTGLPTRVPSPVPCAVCGVSCSALRGKGAT